jgi:hypothetical protein
MFSYIMAETGFIQCNDDVSSVLCNDDVSSVLCNDDVSSVHVMMMSALYM